MRDMMNREEREDAQYLRNTLAMISQSVFAGLCGSDEGESRPVEMAMRAKAGLSEILGILVRRGIGGDMRLDEGRAVRRAALRRLEGLFKEFWSVDGLEPASGCEAFEMYASLMRVDVHRIYALAYDEFGIDAASEARRAEKLGGFALSDELGAKLVDGAAAEKDAPIAVAPVGRCAKRREIRALRFVFAFEFTVVALKLFNLRLCDGKFGAGGYEGAEKAIGALHALEAGLENFEDGEGNGQDIHDVIRRYVSMKGDGLFR